MKEEQLRVFHDGIGEIVQQLRAFAKCPGIVHSTHVHTAPVPGDSMLSAIFHIYQANI